MNPLTQIKNTQKATQREIAAGFSESASWHAKFKHSAYIFAGGLEYTLTEGDLLAVFSQYGEIVDVNLVRCSSCAGLTGEGTSQVNCCTCVVLLRWSGTSAVGSAGQHHQPSVTIAE